MSNFKQNYLMDEIIHYNDNISFVKGEKMECLVKMRQIFGRNLLEDEIYGLAAAPLNSMISIGLEDKGISMDTMEPRRLGFLSYVRLKQFSDQKIVLYLDDFRFLRYQQYRDWLKAELFKKLVSMAQTMGISSIQTFSEREYKENNYYLLPRFGFNAPLPSLFLKSLPSTFKNIYDLQDLLKTEKGQIYWQQYGFGLPLIFDLEPHSLSQKIFKDYLQNFNNGLQQII